MIRQPSPARMGRPLAAERAFLIVAAPYHGWLWNDQLWTVEEWKRAERRRLYERVRKQERRAA